MSSDAAGGDAGTRSAATWPVGLPALGHTMEAGAVREWLVSEGDRVARGDVLAVVESDKVSIEIEAPAEGIVLAIAVEAGQEVPVGTVIATVGQEAGADAAGAAPAPTSLDAPGGRPPADPVAPEAALAERRREGKADRRQATPLARRLAHHHGIDLHALKGSGPAGRIHKADVLAEVAACGLVQGQEPGSTGIDGRERWQRLPRRRRTVAERMLRSWHDQPMVTLNRRADVTDLLEHRAALADRPSLTVLVAAAFAQALRDHPRLNGRIDGERVLACRSVDLSLAVALEDGVVAPVVRDAGTLPLAALAREIGRLTAAAREGRLAERDVADGTATLSNLGALGIESFSPILTPGQIATLGVGAVDRVARERPAGFAFRSEMHLSLTFDHRAVDGADGARLLRDVAALLQAPDRLLETPSKDAT